MGYVSFREGRSCFAIKDKLENPFFHHWNPVSPFSSFQGFIPPSFIPSERHKSVDPDQGFQLALDKKQTRKVSKCPGFPKAIHPKKIGMFMSNCILSMVYHLGSQWPLSVGRFPVAGPVKDQKAAYNLEFQKLYLTAILMPHKSDIHWTFSRDFQLLESSWWVFHFAWDGNSADSLSGTHMSRTLPE